jgi:hypothetical protein
MKEQSLPKGALRLDGGGNAQIKFEETEVEGAKTKTPKLRMVGYSGGVIKNHWYWGNLAIDLNGMKFTKDRYPLLQDHCTDVRLAHMGKPKIENNQLMAPEEDVVFLDNEDTKKFLSESYKGFPFQASIYAKPTKILRLGEEEEHPCNGQMVKGPGAIWMESEYKEMSVCVFGADSNTSAAAFSENETELCAFAEVDITGKPPAQTTKKEVKVMDKAQFMSEHKNLYNEIVAEVKAQFSQPAVDLKPLQDQITALTEENKKLTKENATRKERELASEAKSLFKAKLVESEIPERLHDKIQGMVDHNKFVKDDSLDVAAFGAAVDAEIKDWLDRGIKKEPVVQGEGTSTKSPAGNTKLEENNTLTENLLAMAGQVKKS